MKYLSEYTQDAQTAAFDKAGAFFAFGGSQLAAQRVPGVAYCDMGAGLVCPRDNAKELALRLATIQADGIAADIRENGVEAIIRRELENHEAYYTGTTGDTADSLAGYGIETSEIKRVFQGELRKILANAPE
jgi:hypothetical protein